MEHLSKVMLIESRRRELEREAEQYRLGAAFPRRPMAWRAWLIMAILLIGIIAWWIH